VSPLRLVFLGTPEIACPTLRAVHAAGHAVPLVITQPDRPAGRGRKLRRGALAALADELGLAVAQPKRAQEALAKLAEIAPDLLLVLAYGQILPPPVLAAGRLGAVNLHFSLLPLLRGAAPINWAIIEGHERTGVSSMFMDAGLDTGDLIFQEPTPIGAQETAGSLAQRLARTAAGLALATLEALAAGAAPRTPQDPAAATWARLLGKADGALDWSRPATELDRRVRGLDPWPGAYTQAGGQTLKLFAPTAVWPDNQGQEPGAVLAPRDGLLTVACGVGALGLGQVQAAGKRRQAAAEFLRGARLGPGGRLGA
jgi:methionyl-tRNA formyltransferase